jgi:hypothetical protein
MANFYVYDRNDLKRRLKALGPRIRAQGGMPDAGEFPASKTEILLELVELAEGLLERGEYQATRLAQCNKTR